MVLGLGSRDTQIRRSIETKQQLKCIALYFLHFFKLFKFFFVSPDTKPFSIIRSFFYSRSLFHNYNFFSRSVLPCRGIYSITSQSLVDVLICLINFASPTFFPISIKFYFFMICVLQIQFLDFWDQRNVIFLFPSCLFLITALWNFIRRILLTKRASYHRKLFE